MSERLPSRPLIALAAVMLAGCADLTFERDRPWSPAEGEAAPAVEYLYEEFAKPRVGDREDLHVFLALSGAGPKGSAFAYGLMRALNDVRAPRTGSSLLAEVDVLSAVSGGSAPAAFYVLHGPRIFEHDPLSPLRRLPVHWDANPATFFSDAVGPRQILSLTKSDYNLPDIVADYISEETFEGVTFGSLMAAIRNNQDRPFLLVGATDIVKGRRFEFSQPQFDLLCSDLRSLEVGRMVTASSMPPLITSGVRLRNFPIDTCRQYIIDFIGREESRSASDASRHEAPLNPYLAQKLSEHVRSGEPAFVHLADGSMADSLGVEPVIMGLDRWDSAWSLKRLLNDSPPRKLLIIVGHMHNRLPEAMDYDPQGVAELRQLFPVLSLASSGQAVGALSLAELKLKAALSLFERGGRQPVELFEAVLVSSRALESRPDWSCLDSAMVGTDEVQQHLDDIARMARYVLLSNEAFRAFAEAEGWEVGEAAVEAGPCARPMYREARRLGR